MSLFKSDITQGCESAIWIIFNEILGCSVDSQATNAAKVAIFQVKIVMKEFFSNFLFSWNNSRYGNLPPNRVRFLPLFSRWNPGEYNLYFNAIQIYSREHHDLLIIMCSGMTMNFLPMSFKILHIRYCIHVTLIQIFRSFAIHTCDVHGQCRSRLRLTTLIWSPIARVITLLTRITTPVKVRLSPALLLLETWPISVNTNRWPKQFKYTRTPLAPCISPKTPFL